MLLNLFVGGHILEKILKQPTILLKIKLLSLSNESLIFSLFKKPHPVEIAVVNIEIPIKQSYKILQNVNLLCIDEFGYLPLDLESGQLLFTVISNAYERQSLIITTNLPFNDWGPLFSDDQLAAAIIDRIVHYGHLIKTGSRDWRLEHALMNDR